MSSGRLCLSIALMLALTLAPAARCASKPDFTGVWVVDVPKSDFGAIPAPKAITTEIEHKEPAIRLRGHSETEHGAEDVELNLRTDGTETVNKLGSTEVHNVCRWDGDVLVMETRIGEGADEIRMTARWSLSADLQVFTLDRKWAGAAGETTQKIIHSRKP